MKRRFANTVEGQYSQKRFDEEIFKGYISNIKIQNVANPLVVNNGISKVCIKDNTTSGLKYIQTTHIMQ